MIYTNYRAGWFIKIKPNQKKTTTQKIYCDEVTGDIINYFNPDTGNKVIRKKNRCGNSISCLPYFI
jgi:hypothetical protein